MSLTSIIYDIVHHACQIQVHCPTMISSFKLSLGTVCLPRLCCRAGYRLYIKKNRILVGFNLIHCCTDKSGIVHHARRWPDARNIPSYWTDDTKEYHLWHCVSRTPKPSLLTDHGFEF